MSIVTYIKSLLNIGMRETHFEPRVRRRRKSNNATNGAFGNCRGIRVMKGVRRRCNI